MPEASGLMSPSWTCPPWEAHYSDCAGHGMYICCLYLFWSSRAVLASCAFRQLPVQEVRQAPPA